jgi:uncharacterized protein YajQ (UPF0234 family)
MTIDSINDAFEKVIIKRGIHNRILHESATPYERRLMSGKIRRYRNSLKQGYPISTKIKIMILQKAGIRMEERKFSRSEVVNFVRFFNCQSKVAREDIAYVLEKWETTF